MIQIEQRQTEQLVPNARNARTHSEEQVTQIAASIRAFGFNNPVLIDPEDGIIAGHGRVLAAQRLELADVPVIVLGHLSQAQRRAFAIADNQLALNASWDEALLTAELQGIVADGSIEPALLGFSDANLSRLLLGLPSGAGTAKGNAPSLFDRFLLPPFSVLNAQDGWWQERKRQWLALGLASEVGRDAAPSGSKRLAGYVDGERVTGMVNEADTSVFDPVLCELAYRWFCPAGGLVLDPFAGGSVRGVVASRLGRRYFGVELRAEQVRANEEQRALCLPNDPQPEWRCGDSREPSHFGGCSADMLFTCPPYGNLERYSDEPADISSMEHAAFLASLEQIIGNACARLRRDRFAVIVVGDFRDPQGNYRNFVGTTVAAFRAAGLALYNEAILVTMLGSVPMRTAKMLTSTRKLGKTHQNVLVFLKGDARAATAACGAVDVSDALRDLKPEGEAAPPAAPPSSATRAPILDPEALTPVERIGEIWAKRDDLYRLGAATGCKARTMTRLLAGAAGIVGFGSRKSTMISRVAQVAQHVGLPCRIHTATGEELGEMAEARQAGAELIQHTPGYLSVLQKRAADDAAERRWALIPWGMECPEAIEEGRKQAANIPAGIRRLVIPVGSGMALSALLWGLSNAGRLGEFPILGVRIHADPMARIDKWAPPGWRELVEMIPAGVPFEREVEASLGDIPLDPIYEAKCARFLQPGDLLWIVGIRRSAQREPEPPRRFDIGREDGGPPWANGLRLDDLRAVCRLFAEHDAGLVLGGFSAIKENALAAAHAGGELAVYANAEGRPAAAIVSDRSGHRVKDFAGRVLGVVPAGVLCVARMAGDAERLVALLQAEPGPAWLHLWQERELDREIATRAGFRWVGTKVRASSELVGVWARGVEGLPETPAAEQAALVRLQLPELDVRPLVERLGATRLGWADHYSGYNKGHTWSALALRGYGGRADYILKPAEMARAWKAKNPEALRLRLADTELRAALPEAEPLISAIPGAKHRVRLMRLAPGGGELTRHADITDPDAGVGSGQLLRVHIPLVTNERVRFEQWLLDGARVEAMMRPGEAWYLDTRKPHTAVNAGDAERIHLVIDVESSPALLALLPIPSG